jgi:hypothetical protein
VPETWTITKAQVEQYNIRGPHGLWAIITIDPRGLFQAVSDVGDYAYDGWGHHGRPSFKHFLVQLREADYFLSKVCRGDYEAFSYDRSVMEIRRRVCQRRRDGGLTKDEARACWDEVVEIEHTNDGTYFVMAIERDCPAIFGHLFEHDYCEVPQVQVMKAWPLRFFEEIFRGQLVPALQAEIAAAEQEAPHAA